MASPYEFSKINCCVSGCRNAYYNTTRDVKFYSFPNREHEKPRKTIWVENVRRANKNLTWQPSKYHRICSKHFVGNLKSNHPYSPSYHPTVFPGGESTSSQLSSTNSTAESVSFEFHSVKTEVAETFDTNYENVDIKEEFVANDFSCQVNFEDFSDNNFIFDCEFSQSCEVKVQANVPLNFKNPFTTQDEDNDIKCHGFHGFNSIENDDSLKSLCGITTDTFNHLLSFLVTPFSDCKLSDKNNLLLFLMKLRLGLSFVALGVLFHVDHTDASRIFHKILFDLRSKLSNVVNWPSRECIKSTMPKAFQLLFPNCRAVINCAEIEICEPNTVDQRMYTYSQCKGTFAAKFFIAVAPNGFVSFISKCYGGRASDTYITNDSGFLNLLEPNDVVLAEKGFPEIKNDKANIVVIPPVVHDGKLTLEEIEKTCSIASVRIHVERSIQRIKLYRVLDKISQNLFPIIDDILYMCCILTNLQERTITEEDFD